MLKIDKFPISRRERKKRESKARILKVSRRYFQKKGFENTSIEEISEGADISKSTFFNYFDSKESLLNEIANEEVDKLKNYIEMELESELPAKDKIYTVMKLLVEDTAPYIRITKIVMQAVSLISNKKTSVITKFQSILASLVEEGQVRGEIKKNFNADSIATVIAGAYYMTFFKWVFDNGKFGDEQKAGFIELLDLIFKGLIIEK